MQGAGNDFVLMETGNGHDNWSDMARAMCDRHFGIGADGLLLLMPSESADFRMRIFNADGSESSACGNGLRCLVKHFMDSQRNGSIGEEICVETMAGIRQARIHQTNGRAAEIQVGMGCPSVGQDRTPARVRDGVVFDITPMRHSVTVAGRELGLNLISMGNPHAVCFVDEDVCDFPLLEVGPQVETHQDFADGVNFEIVNARNRDLMVARVWERGVGETLACGSGACAISVAARLLGMADQRVDVRLPGGTLNVEWDGSGEVYLSGPAETVFAGDWS
jgi:diaminopimelate epimerase